MTSKSTMPWTPIWARYGNTSSNVINQGTNLNSKKVCYLFFRNCFGLHCLQGRKIAGSKEGGNIDVKANTHKPS